MQVAPVVWERALHIAGGDYRRLTVVSEKEVIVNNAPKPQGSIVAGADTSNAGDTSSPQITPDMTPISTDLFRAPSNLQTP